MVEQPHSLPPMRHARVACTATVLPLANVQAGCFDQAAAKAKSNISLTCFYNGVSSSTLVSRWRHARLAFAAKCVPVTMHRWCTPVDALRVPALIDTPCEVHCLLAAEVSCGAQHSVYTAVQSNWHCASCLNTERTYSPAHYLLKRCECLTKLRGCKQQCEHAHVICWAGCRMRNQR